LQKGQRKLSGAISSEEGRTKAGGSRLKRNLKTKENSSSTPLREESETNSNPLAKEGGNAKDSETRHQARLLGELRERRNSNYQRRIAENGDRNVRRKKPKLTSFQQREAIPDKETAKKIAKKKGGPDSSGGEDNEP